MRAMLDWDLIRYFLAVARTGSALTAARELKQSQPTVARRIAALEAATGLRLFERRQAGYQLTDEGQALVPLAEQMDLAARGFTEGAGATARRLEGTVRLTCNEMLADQHLAPMLAEFRKAYPDIRVDVLVTSAKLDLARGEADVALRGVGPASDVGEGAGLIARKVASVPWVLFGAKDYVEAHGKPASIEALAGHRIIGGEEPMHPTDPRRWLHEAAPGATLAARVNTFAAVVANVRAGLGLGAAPAGFLENDPNLVACFTLPPELDGQLWLVTHERVRNLPRVRALMDFLAAYVGARRSRLQQRIA
jgi:DNA-binding transcriptional LysR family regulator